jgi:hypothetical protein
MKSENFPLFEIFLTPQDLLFNINVMANRPPAGRTPSAARNSAAGPWPPTIGGEAPGQPEK